jgi:hypothetical protein
MLERLLREIQTGATLQPATLANRLGTSVPMVEAMLDELKRKGLINEVDLGCHSQPCGGCPLASTCGSANGQGRLWQIARKTH